MRVCVRVRVCLCAEWYGIAESLGHLWKHKILKVLRSLMHAFLKCVCIMRGYK